MIWMRMCAVALTTLMIGSMSLAQDAKPEPAPEPKPDAKAEPAKIDPNKAPVGTLKFARVDDIKINDAGRKKDLVLSAVYPDAEGKYPVIIYSHSSGAQTDSARALSEYWASHGYVVLIPAHADVRKSQAEQLFEEYDTDKDGKISKEEAPEQLQMFFDTLDTNEDGFLSKDELATLGNRGGRGGGGGNRGGRGGDTPDNPQPPKKDGEDEFDMVGDPAETLIEDPAQPEPPAPRQGQGQGRQGRGATPPAPLDAKAGVDRVADLKLILDNAEALVKAAPALKGKLDLEKVAVAGHNHGAYTAQLIGGCSVTTEEKIENPGEGLPGYKKTDHTLGDSRVKAILALSPAGADQGGLTKESFKGLKLPMMTMTGSNDSTGEGQDSKWKKQAFELAPEGGKYHVVIEGASNNSFTGPRRMRSRGGNETADFTFDWVKTSTIQFLNATLKGDEAAKTWLSGDGLKEGTAGKAAIERK